jgi:hypothetical protein
VLWGVKRTLRPLPADEFPEDYSVIFLEACSPANWREHLESCCNRRGFVHRSMMRDYLIVGFDTEYQQVHEYLNAAAVREGKAKYQPLSYQFHAVYHDGTEWNGIAVPPEGERMSLFDFMVFVLAKGAEKCASLPHNIILVGHFTKADLPAFEERKPLFRRLTNVRNSLISQNTPISYRKTKPHRFLTDLKSGIVRKAAVSG